MVLYRQSTLLPRGTAHRLDQFDGLMDRLPGASWFDVGCNRGLYSIQAALAGAAVVHGCDAYAPGIDAARQVLADFRDVSVRFEAVDLSKGPSVLMPFRPEYDIVFLSGVVHKIRRQMHWTLLHELVIDIAQRARRMLIWRGYVDEVSILDPIFDKAGLKMRRWVISEQMVGPSATWER